MTAEKIPDEIYWKRCCNDLLSNSDVSLHGGSYKRLFLERHLQKNIESFVPQQTDLFDIKDLLNVMEPYIKRLEITELLPPTLLIVRLNKLQKILKLNNPSIHPFLVSWKRRGQLGSG